MKKIILFSIVLSLFGCKDNCYNRDYKYEVYGIKVMTFNQAKTGHYIFSTNDEIKVGEKYVVQTAPKTGSVTYLITKVETCK